MVTENDFNKTNFVYLQIFLKNRGVFFFSNFRKKDLINLCRQAAMLNIEVDP